MVNEMIERVAKALAVHQFGSPDSWEDQMPMARAAIEAMREPTKAMIVEAMVQPHPSVAESGGLIEQGQAAIRIDYQAMIDEVLK